jgi:predicted PurR-regulated permease PerM
VELTRRERQLLFALGFLLATFLALQVLAQVLLALALVADVLLIFLTAWAVAYLLNPIVDRLDRTTRLNRAGAVGLVYLGLGVLLGGFVALVIPSLAVQLNVFVAQGPEYAQNAALAVRGLQDALDRAGIPIDLPQALSALPQRVAELAGSVAADALGLVAATGALLFNVTLVLIIAFVMLIDGEALWQRFLLLLSDELRSEAELFRQSADRAFGGFIRASLVLGIIYAAGTFAVLAPLGVPFSGVLAMVSGLVMIIPFFGPVIATAIVLAVTWLGAPDRLPLVFVLTLALQQVVLNVIGPRLMANVIGIHPIFVFLALLLGSRIAGFWGVLLAMPIAGIINTFVRYVYEVTQGRRARTDAATLIGGVQASAAAAAAAAIAARATTEEPGAAAARREASESAERARSARTATE